MTAVVLLPISTLRFPAKTRGGVSPKRVEELRRALESGEEMFPIKVHALGDGTYVVRDGRHRIQAHLEAGISVIDAVIDNIIQIIKRAIRVLLKRLE